VHSSSSSGSSSNCKAAGAGQQQEQEHRFVQRRCISIVSLVLSWQGCLVIQLHTSQATLSHNRCILNKHKS
jgi:hypothetical protein